MALPWTRSTLFLPHYTEVRYTTTVPMIGDLAIRQLCYPPEEEEPHGWQVFLPGGDLKHRLHAIEVEDAKTEAIEWARTGLHLALKSLEDA